MNRCNYCNAELYRVDSDSESFAALDIYWLVCPNGHEDPLNKSAPERADSDAG